MTSLLKKTALSLALLFSGSPSSVKCTDLSKALFKIMQQAMEQQAIQKKVVEQLCAKAYHNFFDTKKALNPQALFFKLAFQEAKLEPERIERFLNLQTINVWLIDCNNFFTSLTMFPGIGLTPPLRSAFDVTQDPALDRFVETLHTRCRLTSAEAKTIRVRKFLKLTLQWINKTYIKLADNHRAHFKEIVKHLMCTEIELLLHYARPIITPRCDVFFMGDGKGENKSAITIKLIEHEADGKHIARLHARYIHEADIGALCAEAKAANDECLTGRTTARTARRRSRRGCAGGPAAGDGGGPAAAGRDGAPCS